MFKTMKKNVMMSVVALAAITLASCGSAGGGKPNFGDNEYSVRTIAPQGADLQSVYPATIKGVQDVEIRPKVSGFITKICVHEGQAVKAGQLLFVIDNVTYQAAVNQAKASVNACKAALQTAKLTMDNNQELFDKNVIGAYELQSSKNSYASAEAQLAQAQAAYVSAKQNLDFCFVTSPASGVVGTLPYKVGALVSASMQAPFTTVSDISKMEVYFSMTEKDALELTRANGTAQGAVQSYPEVTLKLADGSTYGQQGKVVTMSGVIDPTLGTVQMKAQFANPEHILKSGGSGNIVVPRNATSAIVIPQDAVAQVQEKMFVYVVGKDNKVKYTEITVNSQNDGKNYIVESGLTAGQRIVVYGITTLTDGMEIKPITEAQYAEKMKKAEAMGADQSDLGKLKNDLTGK